MSQRTRKRRKAEARRRAEQQASLGTAQEGMGRPSIAHLVLQRLEKLDAVEIVQPAKPHIKVAPSPDFHGMPTVPAPVSTVAPPKQDIPKQEVPKQDAAWPENWPVCPKTCNAVEWRRALDNKEFYELRMIEDEGRKPWFQYPRHTWQYSEFVYCTPEMMEALLSHMPVNRPMKDTWADAISRDVLNERWIQSHESIAINTLGNMHDGQHRARGIIKAGRGWPIYITWNVPPEAIYITDSGDKRKINEKLGLLFPDSKLTQKTAALCRAMMWGLTGRGIRYTETEIAEFSVKYHDVILWLATHMRGYRADIQAAIGKSLLWWGESVIGPFVMRLKTINFTGEGDPAKALYLWLQKTKHEGRRASYANPMVYYKKTLSAINAAATNRDAKKIYQKQEDVFEWSSGWEVPQDAPCGGKVLTGEFNTEDLGTNNGHAGLDWRNDIETIDEA